MKCKINLCFILEFMFFLDSSSVVVQIVCNYFCCNEISDSIYYIFDFNFVFTIILASVLNHSLYTRYPIVARALARASKGILHTKSLYTRISRCF